MTSLKDSLHRTIHRNRKSVEQIADDCGMSSSYLYRAGLPSDGDGASGCHFPLEKLIPLIKSTGDCSVLDYIEAAVGRVAIHLPDTHQSPKELTRALAYAVGEFGDVAKAVGEALTDGKVTNRELSEIEKEAWEQIQSMVALMAKLRKAVHK